MFGPWLRGFSFRISVARDDERQAAGHLKLLEGEQAAERIGGQQHGLILTNKRLIHYYRDGSTSRVTVAFLHDIVTARVKRDRRNTVYLAVGILLAMAAFIWSVGGFGSGMDSVSTAVLLVADMVLVIACLTLYLTSSGTVVVFRTPNDEISYRLGAGESMYRFINRWLELKDGTTARSSSNST